MQGLVISKTRSQIKVECDQHVYVVTPTGKMRNTDLVAVGDIVDFNLDNATYLMTHIHPRKSFIKRPRVANINHIFIVQSVVAPDFNPLLIDKMLVYYQSMGLDVSLIITKTDLPHSSTIDQEIAHYQQYGYQVYDIHQDADIASLIKHINHQLVCFVGNSGVGKSTLINQLDPQFNLRTQDISTALNRGKHTTTTTTIYHFNQGKLVDSPGFSTIDLDLSLGDLAFLFFKTPSHHYHCKYSDCLHQKEQGCQILSQVATNPLLAWRYQHYLNFLKNYK